MIPKSFNDAQDVADKFKDTIPVILNLQGSDTDLSKRLIDFASGLTYALDGGMQRIADKVFLLTPRNVEVFAEERARLIRRLLQPILTELRLGVLVCTRGADRRPSTGARLPPCIHPPCRSASSAPGNMAARSRAAWASPCSAPTPARAGAPARRRS